MLKKIVAVVLAGVVLSSASAKDSKGKLVFPESGFSISPLDGKQESGLYQLLMMYLPASEGFSPNVLVRVQEFEGTIQDYDKTTREAVAKAKLMVKSGKTTTHTMTLEYMGKIQNKAVHWYLKAMVDGGKVRVAVATALESQWKASGTKMKACVDSFKRDNNASIYRNGGFSISTLEAKVKADEIYQPLVMTLPLTDKFGPNVLVKLQNYGGTLADYETANVAGIKAAKFKMLEVKKAKDSVTFEFVGDMDGKSLHWYTRATVSGGKVWLTSATAMESQWKSVGTTLKACVDSFSAK